MCAHRPFKNQEGFRNAVIVWNKVLCCRAPKDALLAVTVEARGFSQDSGSLISRACQDASSFLVSGDDFLPRGSFGSSKADHITQFHGYLRAEIGTDPSWASLPGCSSGRGPRAPQAHPGFRVQAGGEPSVQCVKGAILHFFRTMLGRCMRKRCADVGLFNWTRTDDHSFSHVRLMPAMVL